LRQKAPSSWQVEVEDSEDKLPPAPWSATGVSGCEFKVVKGEKVGVRVSMLFVVKVPSSNRNG
jgi:hypothetical protein